MKKNKFSIYSIVLSFIFVVTIFAGCGGSKKTETKQLTKVRLNEVVRSVFYAPMYVAINEGLFKEEGIEVDLTTGQGAEGTIVKTQVL